MPTDHDIISDVLRREGATETNDPLDGGGRTHYGISEVHEPEAWTDGTVTEAEAREIYHRKYVRGPGFDRIPDHALRAQLIDFGVNSGPMIAIMKLQAIVHADVDGVLGPQTLGLLAQMHPEAVSNELVKARMLMICRIVQKNPSQIKYLAGWASRILEFL
jgi:lysozyme family protein